MVFIILCKNLFKNKELEDAISESHLKTNTCGTNLNLIFLSLFIL